MKRNYRIFIMLGLLSSCAGSLYGELLEPGSKPDPTYSDGLINTSHRIFVTSVSHDGNFGGISGADAYCNGLAGGAGLNRTYKAILPTNTVDVNVRINITGPVWIYNGNEFIRVANDATHFWGGINLSQAINRTEFGTLYNGFAYTGSLPDFTFSGGNCSNWTDGSSGSSSEIGSTSAVNTQFISNGSVDCDQPQRVYCISQNSN